MNRAKDILDANNVTVEFYNTGYIARGKDFLVAESDHASYGRALRNLFEKGKIEHEFRNIIISTRNVDNINGYYERFSVISNLEKLGFTVLYGEINSISDSYHIKIVPTDIPLPTWAKYY